MSRHGVIPFSMRRILKFCTLCPHTRPNRYGNAIEDSLKASSRIVLPALQAGGKCLDSREMAGAGDVTAKGAMEAGERGGGGSGG